MSESHIGGERLTEPVTHFDTGRGLAEHILHQSAELWAQAHCGQLTEEERAVDTVVGLLQVNEGCIQRGVEMLCLVYESIRQEDVIRPSFALGKRPLEGVGYVSLLHKVHQPSIEDASKQLAETAGDRDWSVIGGILLRPFLVQRGDIC